MSACVKNESWFPAAYLTHFTVHFSDVFMLGLAVRVRCSVLCLWPPEKTTIMLVR